MCSLAVFFLYFFPAVMLSVHRWWRSLLWSGSCAGWMFIYSIGYYFTVLHMSGVSRGGWSRMLLYEGVAAPFERVSAVSHHRIIKGWCAYIPPAFFSLVFFYMDL